MFVRSDCGRVIGELGLTERSRQSSMEAEWRNIFPCGAHMQCYIHSITLTYSTVRYHYPWRIYAYCSRTSIPSGGEWVPNPPLSVKMSLPLLLMGRLRHQPLGELGLIATRWFGRSYRLGDEVWTPLSLGPRRRSTRAALFLLPLHHATIAECVCEDATLWPRRERERTWQYTSEHTGSGNMGWQWDEHGILWQYVSYLFSRIERGNDSM